MPVVVTALHSSDGGQPHQVLVAFKASEWFMCFLRCMGPREAFSGSVWDLLVVFPSDLTLPACLPDVEERKEVETRRAGGAP